MVNAIITATGSYLPEKVVPNRYFLNHEFCDSQGVRLERPNSAIIEKLQEITGIKERRYVADSLTTSDLAFMAAEEALLGVDRESLDYIIVGHNTGDITSESRQTDMIPCIAARVKHKLRIKNPYTVAFDIPFGCPGWLQATIMADYLIKSGDAKRILTIGAEVLSQIADPHDVDCMIFADGAGAVLIEATEDNAGILSHLTRSDTYNEPSMIWLTRSNRPDRHGSRLMLKMKGHDIYKYAVRMVPEHVKKNLEKAGIEVSEVKKILLHQANEKMDEAMLNRFFKLYRIKDIPADIMPMIISWTGNNSVATLPILLDLIRKGKLPPHRLSSGDVLVFASVGAGMNINSMIYRVP
jgi:3-oxoacyl-[acyl-carrier-protein] synthase III